MASGKLKNLLDGPESSPEPAEVTDEEKSSNRTNAGEALAEAIASGDGAAIADAFDALANLRG